MSGALEGKVAIVTGAGRGLGRAEALALAAHGARVVVNDPGVSLSGDATEDGPADQVVKEIIAAGGQAVANYADCSAWDQAEALVGQAREHFGRLDVLVNSAGILREKMFFNMPQKDWSDVVRVHLDGHAAPSHFAARYWRERFKSTGEGGGRIVNTTSEAGLYGATGQANYVAAKAAVAGLTLALSRELAGYGVTVNAISPRAATRMTEGMAAIPAQHNSADALMALVMDPGDIAQIVAFLASAEAAHINGQVLTTYAGKIELMEPWHAVAEQKLQVPWDLAGLKAATDRLFDGRSSTPSDLSA